MARIEQSETRNVLVSAILIGLVVMAFSVAVLYALTHSIYLDAYYTIETFFDNPNTAASFNLAMLAFQDNFPTFWAIVAIVIIDNLSKILVVSFVIAAVLDIISFTNLEEYINKIRANMLRGHIIMCGYNELAENLINKLKSNKLKVVVIDKNPETVLRLTQNGMVAVTGNFTEVEHLQRAGIANASDIVFASNSDLDNLIGVITAKKLNKKLRIMARVSSDDIRTKMYRAGVDMCVLPEYLAGIELAEQMKKGVE